MKIYIMIYTQSIKQDNFFSILSHSNFLLGNIEILGGDGEMGEESSGKTKQEKMGEEERREGE